MMSYVTGSSYCRRGVCGEEQRIHTFSTSPRAYICRAVRLDIHMGSTSSGGPWSIATPFEFAPFSIVGSNVKEGLEGRL